MILEITPYRDLYSIIGSVWWPMRNETVRFLANINVMMDDDEV
jgi:hypothetical protein